MWLFQLFAHEEGCLFPLLSQFHIPSLPQGQGSLQSPLTFGSWQGLWPCLVPASARQTKALVGPAPRPLHMLHTAHPALGLAQGSHRVWKVSLEAEGWVVHLSLRQGLALPMEGSQALPEKSCRRLSKLGPHRQESSEPLSASQLPAHSAPHSSFSWLFTALAPHRSVLCPSQDTLAHSP